jgi:hypothetical protein
MSGGRRGTKLRLNFERAMAFVAARIVRDAVAVYLSYGCLRVAPRVSLLR